MISTKLRKWFWGSLVGLNTFLFIMSMQMDNKDLATVNILSALGCWVGYFIAEKDHEKESENGD